MERGVKMLQRIMLIALLLGLGVIVFHPEYRDTARAMWWGDIEASAIWDSNRAYYSEVVYEWGVRHEVAE